MTPASFLHSGKLKHAIFNLLNTCQKHKKWFRNLFCSKTILVHHLTYSISNDQLCLFCKTNLRSYSIVCIQRFSFRKWTQNVFLRMILLFNQYHKVTINKTVVECNRPKYLTSHSKQKPGKVNFNLISLLCLL